MDSELRHRIEGNLFDAARAAVEPWNEFKWHTRGTVCDTYQPNSSQALAIDFFGTLKTALEAERNAILEHLSARINLPEAGPWQIYLEWEDDRNRLRESRKRSQVDSVAKSRSATILFECKFGETDGGACSQTLLVRGGLHAGMKQCNGNYEMQENPVNGTSARCALTGKGIKYWELIPSVFRLDSENDYTPCRFNGPWYQWMRNLVLAEEIRRSEGCQTAFIIVYADHSNLPFPRVLKSLEWANFRHTLRMDSVQLETISYQELLGIALGAVGSSDTKWRRLEAWMLEKIRTVGDAFGQSRLIADQQALGLNQ